MEGTFFKVCTVHLPVPAAPRLRFPTLIHCSLCPPKSFPNSLTLSAQIRAEDCKYPCVPLYLWGRISLWFPHRPIDSPHIPLPPSYPLLQQNETTVRNGFRGPCGLAACHLSRYVQKSVVPLVLSSCQWSLRFCSTANVPSALSSCLLLH